MNKKSILWEVSDIKSSSYGKYLSRYQVDRLVAPTEETQNTIKKWLKDHNMDYMQPVPDWFVVQVNISFIKIY